MGFSASNKASIEEINRFISSNQGSSQNNSENTPTIQRKTPQNSLKKLNENSSKNFSENSLKNPQNIKNTKNSEISSEKTMENSSNLKLSIRQTNVQNDEDNKPFTEYTIFCSLRRVKWRIAKKYANFCQLYQELLMFFPNLSLKNSSFIVSNVSNFGQMLDLKNPLFLEEKRKGLENLLLEIAANAILRESELFQRFLMVEEAVKKFTEPSEKYEENSNEKSNEKSIEKSIEKLNEKSNEQYRKSIEKSIEKYDGKFNEKLGKFDENLNEEEKKDGYFRFSEGKKKEFSRFDKEMGGVSRPEFEEEESSSKDSRRSSVFSL